MEAAGVVGLSAAQVLWGFEAFYDNADWVKLVEAFERVKVMVAVSPTPKESSPSSSVIAIVGAVPATVELLVTEVLPRVAASFPWLS